jgi:hypothetical protein
MVVVYIVLRVRVANCILLLVFCRLHKKYKTIFSLLCRYSQSQDDLFKYNLLDERIVQVTRHRHLFSAPLPILTNEHGLTVFDQQEVDPVVETNKL